MSCFDSKGLKEECAGHLHWSVEAFGGSGQAAVAADCATIKSSHASRRPDRCRSDPCASRKFCRDNVISPKNSIFGSEVNGFGKDE